MTIVVRLLPALVVSEEKEVGVAVTVAVTAAVETSIEVHVNILINST